MTARNCIAILFALIIGHPASSQTKRDFPALQITVSKAQLNELLNSTGQKLVLRNPVLVINGDTAKVKDIHSRGNNSLNFQRKSLSIDLKKSMGVVLNGDSFKLRKFSLINLVMDKNLWHNRWAFINLASLDIFPVFNSYSTLHINGQPQGIYLLVEKPHHSAVKAKSPFMIRRGLMNAIADEYAETESKEEIKKYRKQYLTLYNDISRYTGEELFKRLDASLNLDHYFAWLAFNYLVMNGDYEDEVFFYINPGTGKYEIIPWDYDDLFRSAPHEGMEARNSVAGFREKLLFSSEDALDRAIAADEFLYSKYKAVLHRVMESLTDEMLSQSAEQVKADLKELSQDKQLADASRYVGKEPFKFEDAERDISSAISFVINRRKALLSQLK